MRGAPTAAQRRALQVLVDPPKPKRGQRYIEPGVMFVPELVPGYWSMPLELQMRAWEAIAAQQQAALIESSKEDTLERKPEPAL